MNKRLLSKKRILSFTDNVLEGLEKSEVKCSQKILSWEKNKVKLDPINKKDLPFPKSIYPLEKSPVEWWYFTGHLDGKKSLGFEFCFFKFHPQAFRFGHLPFNLFRKKPFLLLHFAVTDKKTGKFNSYQDSGLVHPQHFSTDKLDLLLNESSLSFNKSFKIKTKNELAELELNLKPLKKIVKHFDHGYTVMYSPPEHRTYYLTFPRLKTSGKIKLNGKWFKVTGTSWFDHQKTNVPKRSKLKGWDWFSIILNDQTELMFFMLRTKKGLNHTHMGGSYIKKDSKVVNLAPEDAIIKPISRWISKKTKIEYPSGWELKIPKLGLSLVITPTIKNQEMLDFAAITYWEGACDVVGKKKGKKIKGQSYVELVGYDQRLKTRFLQSFFK